MRQAQTSTPAAEGRPEDLSSLCEKLSAAAELCDVGECERLIALGAHGRADNGCSHSTPLMLACLYGDWRVAEVLIPASDVHAVGRAGQTALSTSADEGHAACLRLLLPHASREDRSRALLRAALGGHADCVAALLPLSDARLRGKDGLDALMSAALSGSSECAKLLIPESDLLAAAPSGADASALARGAGHRELSAMLALARAEHEAACIGLSCSEGAPSPCSARL